MLKKNSSLEGKTCPHCKSKDTEITTEDDFTETWECFNFKCRREFDFHKKCSYLGESLTFRQEVNSVDEAHALISFYNHKGKLSCALHRYNKHQVFSN